MPSDLLETEKKYEVPASIRDGLKDFYGGFADIEATNRTIGEMYRENGYLLDTHTAVAYKVYSDYREATGDKTPTVIASTASPYKFAESVARSIGLTDEPDGFRYIDAVHEKTGVRIPLAMKGLRDKEILHNSVIAITDMEKAVSDSLK